ncbi:hypothetical protein [Pleurocapsa sp. FMAR1]|uniref:hypothetical protein n=1 Tax=Pleurocapsa sp. FMAR1 TaxID=3040204 RepID=UPI0029C69186|nr:hypothetical protein [Pleurocapsa sp. FMAR1]
MSNYQNLFVKLVTSLASAVIISLCFISPATAVTQKLQLNSAAGYIVETTFSYDENQTPMIIKEQGVGKTNVIDSMKVSFYKPSGEIIASYDNIVDGVSQGTYFEFNFAPTTQKLLGNIDLGGESIGEMYLKGEIEQGLSLIEVETTGEEKIIDRVYR